MRDVIFEEFANSDCYGLIFTYMWAFDQQSDWNYVEHVCDIFKKHSADIYYVELVAPQSIRLQRNATENRLKHKATKRDVEMSTQRLINDDNNYRCVSNDGEIPFENYIKIDNSTLPAEMVAKMIKERFDL
ncbi:MULTISPECIES: shikimate kinase [unclassified Clostridium]|nr:MULTISPECIES: shikimate kinase [unclassified Clostridium]WAG71085.1 shikimate kinase [Clostridium sp. CF011]